MLRPRHKALLEAVERSGRSARDGSLAAVGRERAVRSLRRSLDLARVDRRGPVPRAWPPFHVGSPRSVERSPGRANRLVCAAGSSLMRTHPGRSRCRAPDRSRDVRSRARCIPRGCRAPGSRRGRHRRGRACGRGSRAPAGTARSLPPGRRRRPRCTGRPRTAHSSDSDHRFQCDADHRFHAFRSPVGAKRRGCLHYGVK